MSQPSSAPPAPGQQHMQSAPQAPQPSYGGQMYPPTYIAAPIESTATAPYPPNTVILAGVPSAIVVQQSFGYSPVQCVCPNCRNNIVTVVDNSPSGASWLACGLLCLVGFWPCAFLPLCLPGCGVTTHSCPVCNAVLSRSTA